MPPQASGLASTIVDRAFELHEADPERLQSYLREQCAGNPELLSIALQQARIEQQIRDRGFLAGKAANSLTQSIKQGTVIDDFKIGAEIGRGAMGTVYHAIQLSVCRDVAFKTLHSSLGPQAANRFASEARALGKIRSPRVVEIYYYGHFSARPYIAMEYFGGTSLQQLLLQTPPADWRVRVEMALEIAEGLQDIHAMKMAHRDIKPSNVLVRAGQIKVVDFGIAWRENSAETLVGQAMGTPAYMPPEQVLRRLGGPGTNFEQYQLGDIYSFGILLFELLTGVRPFDGKTRDEIEKQIINSPLPLEKLRQARLPDEIVDAVRRATQKDPSVRMRGMQDMIAVLRYALSLPPLHHTGSSGRPLNKRIGISMTVAGSCVLLLASGVLVTQRNRHSKVAPPLVAAAFVPRALPAEVKERLVENPPVAKPNSERGPTVAIDRQPSSFGPVTEPPGEMRPSPASDANRTATINTISSESLANKTLSEGPKNETPPTPTPEEREWVGARDSGDARALVKFASDFPRSGNAASAKDLAARLEWTRLRDKFDREPLNEFVQTFAGHPLAAVADSVRRQLEGRSSARNEILGALNAYAAAMESLKLQRVEAVREMSPAIRKKVQEMLAEASKLEVALRPIGEPEYAESVREDIASAGLLPQSASVECEEKIGTTDHNGDVHPPVNRRVAVQLKRLGRSWLIASMR